MFCIFASMFIPHICTADYIMGILLKQGFVEPTAIQAQVCSVPTHMHTLSMKLVLNSFLLGVAYGIVWTRLCWDSSNWFRENTRGKTLFI